MEDGLQHQRWTLGVTGNSLLAPAILQEFVNNIFRDSLRQSIVMHLDDFLIFSKDFTKSPDLGEGGTLTFEGKFPFWQIGEVCV